jgi:hypothetical protein
MNSRKNPDALTTPTATPTRAGADPRRSARRAPPSLRRILVEAAVLFGLHVLLLQLLARVNVLEHLLSPGRDAMLALAVTAFFLLLRFFVVVFGLGWVAARLWLHATR